MTLLRTQIPSLHNLQSFICSAKHNSFTQAALELHLTQSAVSRQIKELERQLGTPLFHRVRQRVFLTDSGVRFLSDAKKIIKTTEEAMYRTISVGDKLSLNIAALPTFTSRWLIPKLHSFIREHADIVLSFQAITQAFDFDHKSADIAIHYGKPNWPQASSYLICKEQMVAVASDAYLRQHPITDLASINTSHFLHLTSRLGSWKLWLEQHQLSLSLSSQLNFDQFSMVVEALNAGLGIALLPKYFITQELNQGSIKQLGSPIATDECYYLVVPDEKKEHLAVEAFKQWILSHSSEVI